MGKLIGIIGYKQSGKDTIAKILVDRFGFERYAFADPLKAIAMHAFGMTHEQVYGCEKDKEAIDPFWGVSPRKFLQVVGTELFQYQLPKVLPEFEPVGRQVWVKCFERWLINNPDTDVVVSDVRFPHEAVAIKAMGGTLWKVVREGYSGDGHASETEMSNIDNVDTVFLNNGTLEELENLVIDFLETGCLPIKVLSAAMGEEEGIG